MRAVTFQALGEVRVDEVPEPELSEEVRRLLERTLLGRESHRG